MVDEHGNYREGSDLSSLGPPELSEEELKSAVDLSTAPPEKLFQMLTYELFIEDKRPSEKRLGIRAYQLATERSCPERLVSVMDATSDVFDEVTVYLHNITGAVGLYWLLHKYPEEHSWVWLIAVSHERVMRKVGHHFARLVGLVLDDVDSCFSSNFRTVLMNAAATWKKLHADHSALLWNGVAFGLLGDVTSWREEDEEGNAENATSDTPPNVTWSENIIFGNMWVSSVQKWLEYHARDVKEAVYAELSRAQAGLPPDPEEWRWRESTDSVFSPFEFLRRQVHGGWAIDKGLLRGILRYCLMPSYESQRPSLGDFGSGGGRFSEWLNETGLVEAFAFDATFAASDITGGRVQRADLGSKELRLWRTFDWVLCLDVAGHMPEAKVRALIHNIRQHAKRGLIMSWRASALPQPDFVELLEKETGFRFDRETTEIVRKGCEMKDLAEEVGVFRAAP